MSLSLPGRVARVGGWKGYDNPTINVEALFDIWALDPKNSTLGGTLSATGTTPPAVTLTGTLTTPKGVRVEITGAGALGAAIFRVSIDNGSTWIASNVTTTATYTIPTTGLVLNFPAGTYATDNVYRATIASVTDTSPASHHGTQGTPANQPFFTTSHASFNGNPTFDSPGGAGTPQALDVTGIAIDFPVTYLLVAKVIGDVGHNLLNGAVNGSNNRHLILQNAPGALVRPGAPSGGQIFTGGGFLNAAISLVEFTSSTLVSAWHNGLYTGTRTVGTVLVANSWRLLNNTALGASANASMADVRAINRALTQAERRSVFKFFGDKHAIPIALAP